MAAILLRITFRLALCIGVLWLLYPTWGVFAVVLVFAPLTAVALARPIIDLVAESNYHGKSFALADVQGRYWSHRGVRIDIAEDADDARWLRAADVRKLMPGLPRDEVLQRQFPDRVEVLEGFDGMRIRADALADYLAKASDAPTLRFRNWLDREVLGGSRNPRAR